jgi:OmpA-OmpF porin, OOP family
MAKQDGFYAISENLDASTISEYTEIEKTLYLAPVEVGEIIRLNNIFFDYNQASMNNESFAELDRLVELMVQNPNMKIEISGHTDSEGADAYNLKLSQDRATTVENYLLGKNISKTRVVTKGYGESKPLASNDTEAGKAQNRRVEFKILGK